MKNIVKPFALTALALLALAACMTERERQAIAAERATGEGGTGTPRTGSQGGTRKCLA